MWRWTGSIVYWQLLKLNSLGCFWLNEVRSMVLPFVLITLNINEQRIFLAIFVLLLEIESEYRQ